MKSKRVHRECIFIRRGANVVSHEGWILRARYEATKRLYLPGTYHNLTVF